jgi:hypothetical protein
VVQKTHGKLFSELRKNFGGGWRVGRGIARGRFKSLLIKAAPGANGICRKAKFNCRLPGSPYGRPLIEAPNRAVFIELLDLEA